MQDGSTWQIRIYMTYPLDAGWIYMTDFFIIGGAHIPMPESLVFAMFKYATFQHSSRRSTSVPKFIISRCNSPSSLNGSINRLFEQQFYQWKKFHFSHLLLGLNWRRDEGESMDIDLMFSFVSITSWIWDASLISSCSYSSILIVKWVWNNL